MSVQTYENEKGRAALTYEYKGYILVVKDVPYTEYPESSEQHFSLDVLGAVHAIREAWEKEVDANEGRDEVREYQEAAA